MHQLLSIDWSLMLYSIVAFLFIGIGLTIAALALRALLMPSRPWSLQVNDDPKYTRSFLGGSTLLNNLFAMKLPIPASCGGKGTCKQCRVQVVLGGEGPLETETATFSKAQIRQGWRLSCQTKLKRDTQLHVDPHILGVRQWRGKVISNDNVATFIKELIVEVPEIIPYRAGGYLQFHVPPFATETDAWKATIDAKYHADWERYGMFGRKIDFRELSEDFIRAYSVASYPQEGKILKFNIRIASPPSDASGVIREDIPWGVCSSYTFGLKPGDDLLISGPYGESFMINDSRPVIFLIGGAGSSFGRSHILQLFRADRTERKVSLWYGARALKENIYQRDFEDLESQFRNFSYHLVLSEPTDEDFALGWPKIDQVKTNYLFRAFEQGELAQLQSPEECLYYVCGPPMHNKSVMQLLDNYGVPRASILLDDFGN